MTTHFDSHKDTPLERVEAYLQGLRLTSARIDELRAAVAASKPETHRDAITCLYETLASDATGDGEAGLVARIEAAYPELAAHQRAHGRGYRGASMPEHEHWHMRPAAVDRRLGRFLTRLLPGAKRRRHLPQRVPSRLRNIVRIRQLILLFLVALPAVGATFYMLTVLPHQGRSILEIFILILAGLLFAWILTGFWTAMAGFWVLWRGDKYRIRATDGTGQHEPARTAIVMPIYEEDVIRTFAGVRAVYESLEATGRLEEFDFFILSDSTKPDTIAAEERAWAETAHALGAHKRLFYRRRKARVKRKSGNLADFCRRWGGRYHYMIVLDADSVMVGSTLTELVDRMQANPGAGLIQTPPTAVNRSSFLARVQQFATRAYGPMFAAGIHYWHMDNAHYWGHNAIIRLEPFMAYCALPRLPGRGAFAGEILSHDIVEAALMRRAGWGVYIAYDLPGSYEEVPPTLIEELGRDRRWCQGNIQHLRMLFSDNLAPAHRALFANGVMAYTSAAIWFVFLVLSSSEALLEAVTTPDYFPEPGALFPSWPVWQPFWAVSLFVGTMIVLFLPKIIGMGMIIARGEQARFGGVGKIILSTLIEILLTSFLAPVRMLSHTLFVFSTLLGFQVKWNSQQRADASVPWLAAFKFHWPGMLLAVVWGALLYSYTPGFFPWLLPILIPLFIAPALTVLTSQTSIGVWLRKHGLELIPEELQPPTELRRITELEKSARQIDFVDMIVNPALAALHLGLQGKPRRLSSELMAYREELAKRLFDEGPQALTVREKCILLADPQRLDELHQAIWMAETPPDWAAGRMNKGSQPLTADMAVAV